jgi:hypothetical protein
MPTEEKFSAPGFALAAAIRSPTVVQPRSGGTTRTLGEIPKGITGAKSRAGSKPGLGWRAGEMVSAEPWASIVYPSGSALATNAEPIVPPAPTRFSTMMFWPSCTESCSNTTRGMMSVVLPAATGTIARSGFVGHVSAPASSVANPSPATASSVKESGVMTSSSLRFVAVWRCDATGLSRPMPILSGLL